MGQAKLKKSLPTTFVPEQLLLNLSRGLKKLSRAASENYGADCITQAVLAQAALKKHGYETKVVAGYAAWRVGEGDSDVISHLANVGTIPEQVGNLVFHVWLEHGNRYLDFTTYQLKEKAKQLDQLDGGTTQVDWCPEYLYIDKFRISSVEDVLQKHAGLFHYKKDKEIEEVVFREMRATEDNETHADLIALLTIMESPDVVVYGLSGESDVERSPAPRMKP